MNDSTADFDAPEVPGPDVPDFELLRMIGHGGFGQVWLATNRITGHLRAVKVIPLAAAGTTDPAGREIGSLTRLEECLRTHHPNLVEIQHVGKTAEHLFYVMEPADAAAGGPATADADYRPATLQGRIEAGPLPADECLRRTRELLAGLTHLHNAGMVHRDVKPANCLLIDGRLKLADFGLVVESTPLVSRVGTRRYMPPDGRMDTRADVFAAGLVVYEMLTGLPVEDFPRLGQRAKDIAEGPILGRLNRLVLRACQPQRNDRFRDAAAMLAALDAPPRPRGRHRGLRRRMAGWLGAIVAATIAVVFVTQGPWAAQPGRVGVSFITEPFEATILVDDQLLVDAEGVPRTTPCTVEGLSAEAHRVVFRHEGLPDCDAGEIDFAAVREIAAQFEPSP